MRNFRDSLSPDRAPSLFPRVDANVEKHREEDKRYEIRKGTVRRTNSASGPNENEIARELRHAKTACLMVSLVRKESKHSHTKWSSF